MHLQDYPQGKNQFEGTLVYSEKALSRRDTPSYYHNLVVILASEKQNCRLFRIMDDRVKEELTLGSRYLFRGNLSKNSLNSSEISVFIDEYQLLQEMSGGSGQEWTIPCYDLKSYKKDVIVSEKLVICDVLNDSLYPDKKKLVLVRKDSEDPKFYLNVWKESSDPLVWEQLVPGEVISLSRVSALRKPQHKAVTLKFVKNLSRLKLLGSSK